MRRSILSLVVPLVLAAGPVSAQVSDAHRAQALERFRAGLVALMSEAWPDAEQEFKSATALDPLLVWAHYGLGQTFMALKEYDSAVSAFRDCREASRRIAALRFTDRVQADHRAEEEILELNESLRRIAQGQVAVDLNTLMRIEERIKDLERTKRRDRVDMETPAEISLALGSAYFRAGSLDNAEREYRAALRARPGYGEAHNNLAVIYMKKGRFQDARRELTRAERAEFHVDPRFKTDLDRRLRGDRVPGEQDS